MNQENTASIKSNVYFSINSYTPSRYKIAIGNLGRIIENKYLGLFEQFAE